MWWIQCVAHTRVGCDYTSCRHGRLSYHRNVVSLHIYRAARKIVNSGGQMATARNRTKSTQLRAERNLASSKHIHLARLTRESLRRAFFYRFKRHWIQTSGQKMIYDTRTFNTARGVRSLSFDFIRVRIVRVVTIRQINGKSQGVRKMYLSG